VGLQVDSWLRKQAILVAAALWSCGACSPASAGVADLRVYAVQPGCFPYLFTSRASQFGDKPVLAFNDLGGRTHFVAVGDRIGDYTVEAYEPRSETVFNASINAYQEKDRGRVALVAEDGSSITLVRGEPLEQPGWLACLVSLASGDWHHALQRDDITIDDIDLSVQQVNPTSVVASAKGGAPTRLPAISGTERTALRQLWEDRRREREETLKQAEEERRKQKEAEAAREVARALREARPPARRPRPAQPRHFFGTEIRYPVEFEVIPVFARNAAGGVSRQAIVVPKRFESRMVGTGTSVSTIHLVPRPAR
jgi:hypothetical protein